MTFDLKMWHALRVHICLVCFANILCVFYLLFYRRILISSCFGWWIQLLYFHFALIWPLTSYWGSDTFPHLASTRTVVRTHQGTQLAWMSHSAQFCHQSLCFATLPGKKIVLKSVRFFWDVLVNNLLSVNPEPPETINKTKILLDK